jgi:hypothetical protein
VISVSTSLVLPRPRAPRFPRGILAHLASLYQRAGNLVRTASSPFHLSDCGGPGAPCTCNWPTGLAPTYQVQGLAGLSPCPTCDSSADPAWDGTLYNDGPGCVWWAADAAFDPRSINGVSLDILYTQVLLRTNVSPCRWELYIACGSATNPTRNMWVGYKTTGSTPAGTYAFVSSDCGNTTPTMTVT